MIKIDKFVKQKDGNYKLKLEDSSELIVHEDLILKYELLLTKNLEQEKIETIKEEQKIYDLYNVALKYIKVKIRSVKEIKLYLEKKQYNQNQINHAIDLLLKQGYLNNELYVKALIHDRIHLSNDGPLKIKNELEKNDILEEIIDKYLNEFTEELEKERIEKLVKKQISQNHNKSNNMIKKKIEMNLVNLGYHKSLINEVLSSINIEDKDIYKKEYEKLEKKLSRKYQGKELELKIKQKLYQKGFRNVEE